MFYDTNVLNATLWLLVGWLFCVLRPFEAVFQSISDRLPERVKEKRKDIREKKMSKQPPSALTASAIGSLALLLSKLVGSLSTESLPSTFAPPDHLLNGTRLIV